MLCVPSLAFGLQSHVLFGQDRVTPGYYIYNNSELIVNGRKVNSGDHLVLESGDIIVFNQFLGSGNNTIVFEDDRGNAVRLAQFVGSNDLKISTSGLEASHSVQMALGFMESYYLLRSVVNPKSLVKILDLQYQSDFVTVVEYLKVTMTLNTFLSVAPNSFDPRFIDLILFLESFEKVKVLPDFLPFQIGYVNGRGWVLMDYGLGVKIKHSSDLSSSVYDLIQNWKPLLRPRAFEMVMKALNHNQKNKIHNPRSCALFLR